MVKMIPGGHYQLARDVRNPHPDKRSKRSLRKVEFWKAGTRVFVRVHQKDSLVQQEFSTIEFVNSRYPSLDAIGPGMEEQYEALRDALEPCTESFQAQLHRLEVTDTYWILRRLVLMGKLTHDDIEAAKKADEEAGE